MLYWERDASLPRTRLLSPMVRIEHHHSLQPWDWIQMQQQKNVQPSCMGNIPVAATSGEHAWWSLVYQDTLELPTPKSGHCGLIMKTFSNMKCRRVELTIFALRRFFICSNFIPVSWYFTSLIENSIEPGEYSRKSFTQNHWARACWHNWNVWIIGVLKGPSQNFAEAHENFIDGGEIGTQFRLQTLADLPWEHRANTWVAYCEMLWKSIEFRFILVAHRSYVWWLSLGVTRAGWEWSQVHALVLTWS